MLYPVKLRALNDTYKIIKIEPIYLYNSFIDGLLIKILKTDISQTNLMEVSDILQNKNSISVAICNVNTLVRSYKNSKLQEKINSFDIKAPDGFPVAKASNLIYKNNQKRVDGFNVFHETINKGLEKESFSLLFWKQQRNNLIDDEKLKLKYPKINIVGYYCPPTKKYTELTMDYIPLI